MTLTDLFIQFSIFVIVYYLITKFVFKTNQAEKNTLIASVVYILVGLILEAFVFK